MDVPAPEDLQERRKDLDLTQSELADRADVSQPLIARIEGGDVDPRLSTLRRIVNALEDEAAGVLRARDLMHQPVISVAPDDAVHEAERAMNEAAVSQLPVLRAGDPVGSISHSDASPRARTWVTGRWAR
jgi:predicted transcriptional regulator